MENAAPKKTFMRPEDPISFRQIADDKPLLLDMLPVHYLSHLMHALQVIAYRNNDLTALRAYEDLCEYLHLGLESPEVMKKRLSDEVEV